MLMYLVKHSRPDIANPVRELSRGMGEATRMQFNEMMRVIAHTLDNEKLGLKMKPIKRKEMFQFKGLSDSSWAEDNETRKSVTGYVVYFMGVPVSWRSKGQQIVALSTTEAEYYALSEVVMEIKFLVQIVEFMGLEVEYPVNVFVDNVGAIYLSRNATSSNRTKHIDAKTHFVRDYQEDGKILVKFVRSEDNDSDIMTKNVTTTLYQKHSEKMVWNKDEMV